MHKTLLLFVAITITTIAHGSQKLPANGGKNIPTALPALAENISFNDLVKYIQDNAQAITPNSKSLVVYTAKIPNWLTVATNNAAIQAIIKSRLASEIRSLTAHGYTHISYKATDHVSRSKKLTGNTKEHQ